MKKVLSLLIVLALVISMVPAAFAASGPAVTISDDVTVWDGERATFSVTATGEGELSYVWYYRVSETGAWKLSKDGGKNTATLRVNTNVAKDGYQYACKVTDSTGSTLSEPATLTVEYDPLSIDVQPQPVSAYKGDVVKFSVETTGAATYRWYYRRTETQGWRYYAGEGFDTPEMTLTVTGIGNGYQYMCLVKDSGGNKAYSEPATLTVLDPEVLGFSAQPDDVIANEGDTVSFRVYTTGTVYWKWYYRTSPTGSWKYASNLEGATGTDSYKMTVPATAKMMGYQFGCQITGVDGTKMMSEAADLIQYEDLAIVADPQDVQVEDGQDAVFAIDAKGVSTYKWYYRVSETGSWKIASYEGCATAEMTVPATLAMNGYQFACQVYDANGAKILSAPATLTVGPAVGSEENPIYPEFAWNEEQTEATVTVTVPGKTTYYFGAYVSGMELTVNGESYGMLNGSRWMPAIFTIKNDGAAEATYELKISYPAGSMENPNVLVIGANSAVIAEGNTQGYFFTYTAEDDGVLTITMPEGDWAYVINNMTSYQYGDTQWSDSDPVVSVAQVAVSAGDEIQIMVSTYDPNAPWSAPAGQVVFSASFEALSDTEIGEDITNPDDGEA